MAKLIGSICVSLFFYTIMYFLFFDSAEERVEKTTLKDLLPYYMMQPIDEDVLRNKLNRLEKNGVKTNRSLIKSLKNNKYVSDFEITATTPKGFKGKKGAEAIKIVEITFNLDEYAISMPFTAIDKGFLRFEPHPFAIFLNAPTEIYCTKDGKTRDFSSRDDLVVVMISIFSSDENHLKEVLKSSCAMLFKTENLKDKSPDYLNSQELENHQTEPVLNYDAMSNTHTEAASPVFGQVGGWSSGWGQGISEYQATVTKDTYLYIACGKGKREMIFRVKDKLYDNESQGTAFNIEIDGVIEEPYELTDIWEQMRMAKKLRVVTLDNGVFIDIPVSNIQNSLPNIHSKEFTCGY